MDDPLPQSPYKTLGVPKDATLATIRSAHRKLVLSCHPDKVQDPAAKIVKAEEFHQVQQAYEILSDEKRRQRYDEKVKLEELRAEMEEERRPAPRRTPDYTPRPAPAPRYETTHAAPVYETERRYNTRPYEEDAFAARFAEERPSARKFDSYAVPPSRKVSGRGFEEKDRKKSREGEEERERDCRRRESEKARDTYDRDQRNRKRDKDRKRDTEAKMRSKHTYVDDDDESDSELDDRYYKSRRDPPPKVRYDERYDEPRRGSRDEIPPRKRDARGYDDELMTKEMNVQDYISKSREAIDIEPRHTELRRPTRTRANSTAAVMTTSPPPPAPAHSGKRSVGHGGRGGRETRNPSPIRSSKKDKRMPEIVESPPARKPSLPKASSESKGIKSFFSPSSSSSRRPPQRAATYQQQQPAPEFKPGPMRRSETMPIDQLRRGDTRPLHTSNLKNMKAPSEYSSSDDSDSDSMMTEEPIPIRPPPPRQSKTNYKYVQDEAKLVGEPVEIYPPQKSDESPRVRLGSDRPTMSSRAATTRPSLHTTPRTASYAFPQDERSSRPSPGRTESTRAPPLQKHQSARNNDRLYGEYSSEEKKYKTKDSPKIHADEERYTRSPRGELDRDAWPGSFKPRSRPQMSRGETAAY
jgi:curved DNA-binding protein CbpA